MNITCGILDYSVGNLGSVSRALEKAGAETSLINRPQDVMGVDVLVLPGVGAFGAAMASLRERDCGEAVVERARADKPIVGICLGMHLLFESSDEAEGVAGLGILPGHVRRLSFGPRIGWEPISPVQAPGHESDAFGIASGGAFFFCHNYHVPSLTTSHALMACHGPERSVAVLEKANIVGLQFHPERSQIAGLRLLAQLLHRWTDL